MAKEPGPPQGFTPEEWSGWQIFQKNAHEIADAIKCDYDTALLIMGLNEIATEIGELREMLESRGGPDEPWKQE